MAKVSLNHEHQVEPGIDPKRRAFSRRWLGLAILLLLFSLLVATVSLADGLGILLSQLHVAESSTPPSTLSYGSQLAHSSASYLVAPPHIESSSTDPTSREMTPAEAQAILPFTLQFPTYIPKGFHLTHVAILPLTTERAAIELEDTTALSTVPAQANIEILEYPSQLDDGNSPYQIPQGTGQIVQVAGADALYVDAVWSGNPPQRDDRFHQLIFLRDGLKFFLYAPRERIPVNELIAIAGSLRPGSP